MVHPVLRRPWRVNWDEAVFPAMPLPNGRAFAGHPVHSTGISAGRVGPEVFQSGYTSGSVNAHCSCNASRMNSSSRNQSSKYLQRQMYLKRPAFMAFSAHSRAANTVEKNS